MSAEAGGPPVGGDREHLGLGAVLPGVAAGMDSPEFTLLELADRLLNRGVVLVGEATISVAGVDLVYLGLNLVLTSVENLRPRPAASADERTGSDTERSDTERHDASDAG
jgi:gas vesicle structural protein